MTQEEEIEFNEFRDIALNFYEASCDVHSEKNYVAILKTLETFKSLFNDLIAQRELKGERRRIIEQIREEEKEKLRVELVEKIEKLYQDEYPVDCIDGVTPVETYGYEATHNQALKKVLNLIHTNKETI